MHHLDSAIGNVLEVLEKSGQRHNTIIMFSSDNGPWMTSKGGGYPSRPFAPHQNGPNSRVAKAAPRHSRRDAYLRGPHPS